MTDGSVREHIAVALEHFRRVDAGEPRTDMFAEDAQLLLPKFGTGHGLSVPNRNKITPGKTQRAVGIAARVTDM